MMRRLFARRSFSCPKIAALAIQIVCCWLASATCADASGYCAHFEFPDLGEDLVKTANAHTRVTIPFRLIASDTCSWNQTFVLVSEPSDRSAAGLHQDYCVVQVRRSGGCMSFSNTRCQCQGGKGDAEILFTKTVDRGDNGTWLWWTRERISRRVTVDFIIQEFPTSASTPTTPTTTINTTTSATTTSTTTTSTTQAEQLTATAQGSNDQQEHAAEGNQQQSTSHSSGEDGNDNNDDSISNSSSSGSSNGDANVDEEDDNNSSDDVGYDVDWSATAGASATMKSSYVGVGIVAGVNVTTVIVIGSIIVCFRVVCVRRGRRRQDLPPPPPPCSLNIAMTLRRRSELQMEAQYDQCAERLSLSSRIYEEIPVAPMNEMKDTSIYLSPTAGAD